jgi:hypothetical protein
MKPNVNNTSGYPGVRRMRGRWQANIVFNYHTYHLGTYDTPQKAFAARCNAKLLLHQFQPFHRDLTKEQRRIERAVFKECANRSFDPDKYRLGLSLLERPQNEKCQT